MKTWFSRTFSRSAIFAGLYFGFIGAGLAQTPAPGPGGDTPTGVAGGFGGTMEIGSGSFDPYEMNATRPVTDVVVPGSVVPFAYTRIWNSRSKAWSDNWSWRLEENDTGDLGPGAGINDHFLGYVIHYPDGRVVYFGKPNNNDPPGTPGTYSSAGGIVDRFVVLAGGSQAQLRLSDGSVVNFPVPPGFASGRTYASSIVDPHGLAVTFSYNGPVSGGYMPDERTITEPGGRWIHIGPTQGLGQNHQTIPLITSLGQSVTYTLDYHNSGYYASPGGSPQQTADPYGATILGLTPKKWT